MRVTLIISAALAVSACATNNQPGPPGTYFAKLSAACSERGGSLVPQFGYGSTGGYRCSSGAGADARYVGPTIEAR